MIQFGKQATRFEFHFIDTWIHAHVCPGPTVVSPKSGEWGVVVGTVSIIIGQLPVGYIHTFILGHVYRSMNIYSRLSLCQAHQHKYSMRLVAPHLHSHWYALTETPRINESSNQWGNRRRHLHHPDLHYTLYLQVSTSTRSTRRQTALMSLDFRVKTFLLPICNEMSRISKWNGKISKRASDKYTCKHQIQLFPTLLPPPNYSDPTTTMQTVNNHVYQNL